MRKFYRIAISIISLIGSGVMLFQHDYMVMVILLVLSIIFFVKRNQVNNSHE